MRKKSLKVKIPSVPRRALYYYKKLTLCHCNITRVIIVYTFYPLLFYVTLLFIYFLRLTRANTRRSFFYYGNACPL